MAKKRKSKKKEKKFVVIKPFIYNGKYYHKDDVISFEMEGFTEEMV